VRRSAFVAACGLAMTVLLLGGAVPAASAAKRKRRSGCGSACRQLGIPQGEGGAYCGATPWLTTATETSSATLSVPVADINPVNPGDLLLAAIESQTGGVVPPSGWTEVPNTDYSVGTSEQLQLFYTVPVPLGAPDTLRARNYLFRAPTPQAMTGTLTDFEGVSQSEPISASGGQANPTASNQVLAPSIAPAGTNSVLVFVGASAGPEKWTAPAGMTAPMAVSPSQPNHPPFPTFPYPPNGIGVAFGPWSSGSTGPRTATIDTPSASIGELVALNIPAPITCPKVRILNRRTSFLEGTHREHGPLLEAGANGLVPIRLRCEWTAPCVGAIGVFSEGLVWLVASDITVPAGQTRTLKLPTCRLDPGCPERKYSRPILDHSQTVVVAIQILAESSNGQLIPAARNADMVGQLVIRG
jgi:hypothetical protein